MTDSPATPAAEPPPPSARVEIAHGDHQVAVEAPEPLANVTSAALELWRATASTDTMRPGGTTGFTTELAYGQVPPVMELPNHLSWGDTDDRARNS